MELTRTGFVVKLVTHAVHANLVKRYNLAFAGVNGDPGAVLRSTAFREAVTAGSTLQLASLFKKDADTHLTTNMVAILAACRDQDAILCNIACLTECCGERIARTVRLTRCHV